MQNPDANQQLKTPDVLRLGDFRSGALASLLGQFGLKLVVLEDAEPIPGSYWGEEEAGLVGNEIFARADTPLHSILHESCHYLCMDPVRRHHLDTDAGGDYDEENAVCFLQILLAERLEGFSARQMMKDMDAWGYTFRLGSARAWFERDADDAWQWLIRNGLLDHNSNITGSLRH